jgi:hypothetical protein
MAELKEKIDEDVAALDFLSINKDFDSIREKHHLSAIAFEA